MIRCRISVGFPREGLPHFQNVDAFREEGSGPRLLLRCHAHTEVGRAASRPFGEGWRPSRKQARLAQAVLAALPSSTVLAPPSRPLPRPASVPPPQTLPWGHCYRVTTRVHLPLRPRRSGYHCSWRGAGAAQVRREDESQSLVVEVTSRDSFSSFFDVQLLPRQPS